MPDFQIFIMVSDFTDLTVACNVLTHVVGFLHLAAPLARLLGVVLGWYPGDLWVGVQPWKFE